jgi:uncharacterized protein YjaG (DUF416 family)
MMTTHNTTNKIIQNSKIVHHSQIQNTSSTVITSSITTTTSATTATTITKMTNNNNNNKENVDINISNNMQQDIFAPLSRYFKLEKLGEGNYGRRS